MNFYPYNFPGLILQEDDLCIIRTELGHLCGYCSFALHELPESWHGDYNAEGLQYLAVHGGITFAQVSENRAVYGFDCAHSGDASNPQLRDPFYVLQLARQMRDQLALFATYHNDWQVASREERAAILDEVTAQATLPAPAGLGQMLDLLCGAPGLGEEA